VKASADAGRCWWSWACPARVDTALVSQGGRRSNVVALQEKKFTRTSISFVPAVVSISGGPASSVVSLLSRGRVTCCQPVNLRRAACPLPNHVARRASGFAGIGKGSNPRCDCALIQITDMVREICRFVSLMGDSSELVRSTSRA